jgi:hypothetical protein
MGQKQQNSLNLAFASCSAVTLLLFPHWTLQFSRRPQTLISQTEATWKVAAAGKTTTWEAFNQATPPRLCSFYFVFLNRKKL